MAELDHNTEVRRIALELAINHVHSNNVIECARKFEEYLLGRSPPVVAKAA